MNKLSKFIKQVLLDKLVNVCDCLDRYDAIFRNLLVIGAAIVAQYGLAQSQAMKSLGGYRYSVKLLLLAPIDWVKPLNGIDESVNDNKKIGRPSEKWQLIVKIVD
ncbi:hypothetical protein [Shewanella sp. S1-58-MNA-CIBAN-0166]|uniref:hypothetical protein n=1 Tax=Shewanella sp. S1-58-MNA-CIBAN-0166 TaxID=3140467 RepID=UPI000E7EB4C3|nr:hypothetical protein [Shewanella frigidimarina]